MNDTFHIRPCRIDGGVQSEAGLVDSQIGAAPVHDLTLKVYLHLRSEADDEGFEFTDGEVGLKRQRGLSRHQDRISPDWKQ